MTEGILNDNVPAYRYMAGGGLGLLLALSGLGGIGVLIALGFYMPFQHCFDLHHRQHPANCFRQSPWAQSAATKSASPSQPV